MEEYKKKPTFEEKAEEFLEGKTPSLKCDTVKKREKILQALGAKIEAAYKAYDLNEESILIRPTSDENILVEDHIPKDSSQPTTFEILRIDKNDN